MPELPADNHVHSQWSWDADRGSMVDTCARAVELGLPSVAFTEHLDSTRWTLLAPVRAPHLEPMVAGGRLRPTHLDVEGYLACVAECRDRFPGLRILTGVEMGEPHWHADAVAPVLAGGRFERRLASVHSARREGAGRAGDVVQLDQQMRAADPGAVVSAYLAEVLSLIETFDDFQVLAHVDYPARYWRGGMDVTRFEDGYRTVLRALARAGKALEVNTRVPLDPVVLRWWREEGGGAISFASDAHRPDALAHGFAEAVRVARAAGFRPGRDPVDLWGRD